MTQPIWKRVLCTILCFVLVLSVLPAAADVVYEPLKYGMEDNDAITKMQKQLKKLGYFKVSATGNYYDATADAVVAFQKANDLPVDRKNASAEMQALLFASVTEEPAENTASTPSAPQTPAATSYETLKYGMKDNASVKAMQKRLKEMGFLKSTATGGYFDATAAAVAAFQQSVGLPVNEKAADSATLCALYGTGGETVPEVKEPASVVDPQKGETAVTYGTLTYGMADNDAVRALQVRLKELGYLKASATGNYWDQTAAAMRSYLAVAGMSADGKTATAEMQKKLFSSNPLSEMIATPSAENDTDTTKPSNNTGTISTDYSILKYGMENSSAVRAMQKRLKELGYFDAKTDCTGNYYSTTSEAVAAFQKAVGLTVNGREASALMQGLLYYYGDLDKLLATGYQIADGTNSNEQVDYSNAKMDIVLNKGASGTQVDLLICRLMELGYIPANEKHTSYDSMVVEAVKWFQDNCDLEVDGIVGPLTLTKLYGNKAITAADSLKSSGDSRPVKVSGTPVKATIGSVLNVDFFSQAADVYFDRKTGIFKDGATAIVTDVKTGKAFMIKRCGGYNHVDVEPLTAYDTWIMYELYDENWSWTRRAVYMTLSNGVTFAGSMNGMPHGKNTIGDNNFDGQFCIHFLNSRTSGSDKVDPDHQAAIEYAVSANSKNG